MRLGSELLIQGSLTLPRLIREEDDADEQEV